MTEDIIKAIPKQYKDTEVYTIGPFTFYDKEPDNGKYIELLKKLMGDQK